jgi:hypothetical protein
MPIYESDPWRVQYFTGIDCPADVHIPTDDTQAYEMYPRQRFIYDKLLVARSQGLECGPHGTPPGRYPVFCKPVINLKGMGSGSCVLHDERDYLDKCRPGDFWTRLMTGEHISTDWAVIRGRTAWCRHTLGIPGPAGTFDYWVVQARARPGLERFCRDWIGAHLAGYTGMVNIETIGGRIIEAHLRFADQWPDLYGHKWLRAMVGLYHVQVWEYADAERADGYSVVLFGPHGISYRHPSAKMLAAYRATLGVSSVQITFFEDRPQGAHVMPPGGFRLAVINSFNLQAGLRLRAKMARDFGLEEQLQRSSFDLPRINASG